MATSYPTALDTLTNPTSSDTLDNPSHSDQHADANDAIEALQSTVGLTGTSFPVSPSTGDRFYRTDENIEYIYNGTNWLSVHVEVGHISLQGSLAAFTAAGTLFGPKPAKDIYIIEILISVFPGGTNDSSNYWTITPQSFNGSAAATNIGSAVNTSGDGTGGWVPKHITVGGLIAAAAEGIQLVYAKVGAPTSIFITSSYRYRLVGS